MRGWLGPPDDSLILKCDEIRFGLEQDSHIRSLYAQKLLGFHRLPKALSASEAYLPRRGQWTSALQLLSCLLHKRMTADEAELGARGVWLQFWGLGLGDIWGYIEIIQGL